MAQDYEVARKIWDAKVPVEFILESDALLDTPKPYYVMLPRSSYFPVVLPKAVHHFTQLCENISVDLDTLWLEYNRTPIKTYYPIGVLHDLLKTDDSLPWTITIKTKDPPLNCPSIGSSSMQSIFLQSVKEADYLRRKADVVTKMRSEEHKQLWNGLVHGRFEEFWAVNQKLVDSEGPMAYAHIPIRLYEANHPIRQVPIPPSDPSGSPLLLTNALACLDPSLDPSLFRFVSHGIELPLETPLLWMAKNLAYPDNFIHVIAIPAEKN